jgi:hypothetical protein
MGKERSRERKSISQKQQLLASLRVDQKIIAVYGFLADEEKTN